MFGFSVSFMSLPAADNPLIPRHGPGLQVIFAGMPSGREAGTSGAEPQSRIASQRFRPNPDGFFWALPCKPMS